MHNKWELWWADVRFEDDLSVVKRRPVLVVEPGVYFSICLKVTTHQPRPEFQGEYIIKEWKAAGLSKESTIRISKRLRISSKSLVKKIGMLQMIDIYCVQKMLAV